MGALEKMGLESFASRGAEYLGWPEYLAGGGIALYQVVGAAASDFEPKCLGE